jgi:hypothetical protein
MDHFLARHGLAQGGERRVVKLLRSFASTAWYSKPFVARCPRSPTPSLAIPSAAAGGRTHAATRSSNSPGPSAIPKRSWSAASSKARSPRFTAAFGQQWFALRDGFAAKTSLKCMRCTLRPAAISPRRSRSRSGFPQRSPERQRISASPRCSQSSALACPRCERA